MSEIINLDNEELFIKEKSEVERMIEREKVTIQSEFDNSMRKLKDSTPILPLAFQVKNSWESAEKKRESSIIFNVTYNWGTSGFELRLVLGPDDKIKSVSDYLRPLKYSPLLKYKNEYIDKQNGVVGGDYLYMSSDQFFDFRTLEVRIVTMNSQTCHRVQVGTKEVPIYEVQCEEPSEELIDEGELKFLEGDSK